MKSTVSYTIEISAISRHKRSSRGPSPEGLSALPGPRRESSFREGPIWVGPTCAGLRGRGRLPLGSEVLVPGRPAERGTSLLRYNP